MINCQQTKQQLESLKTLKQDFDDVLDNYKNTRELETILAAQQELEQAISEFAEHLPWSVEKAGQMQKRLVKWAEEELNKHPTEAKKFIDRNFKIDRKKKQIEIHGSLYLTARRHLKTIPDNLSVKESLDLGHCVSLKILPDGLSVGGTLTLKGCRSLKRLPSNLGTGWDLDLRDCPLLTELPDQMLVGKNIFVDKALENDAQKLKKLGKIKGEVIV